MRTDGKKERERVTEGDTVQQMSKNQGKQRNIMKM